MRIFFIVFMFFVLLSSCDFKNPFAKKIEEAPVVIEPEIDFENESLTLYSTLENLTVRNGDSLKAAFITKIKEGEKLEYLDQHSRQRLNLVLRGKYHHEPWLKVKTESGKIGWVYGGGVRFESKARAEKIQGSSRLSAQRFAVDTAWTGDKPTDWAIAGIEESVDFKTFLIHFKDWVANDEIDKISKHISYPADPIYNKRDFKKNYEKIFDSKLKRIVAEQRLDQIFRDAQGATFGDGAIWFGKKQGGYRIISIPTFAEKVEEERIIEDYRTTFADLEALYQRPTKEANPPRIRIILKEKAISGEFIKYIGNAKESVFLEDLKFTFSEKEEKIFERKGGIEVLQRMTFTEKSSSVVELKYDDYENFGVGQRFVLVLE